MIRAVITDAAPLLTAALRRSAAAAGVMLDVAAIDDQPWASLTFNGARHRVAIAAPAGPAIDEWLAALASATLRMRGHVAGEPVVVDLQERAGLCVATLEVVTVEDG